MRGFIYLILNRVNGKGYVGQKLSVALKGRAKPPRSDEHRANMSAAKRGQNKGKPWSPARRAAAQKEDS